MTNWPCEPLNHRRRFRLQKLLCISSEDDESLDARRILDPGIAAQDKCGTGARGFGGRPWPGKCPFPRVIFTRAAPPARRGYRFCPRHCWAFKGMNFLFCCWDSSGSLTTTELSRGGSSSVAGTGRCLKHFYKYRSKGGRGKLAYFLELL